MLKKNNKLITIFILAFFMFSIVGSAGAAQFSDVDPATDATPAIYKLAALGILEGYPDGTFAPDNTITRAEFAKIAVVTAGLERVASGMTGVPTQFNDVAADHWASGWINVAAAQDFVQGDGDGIFRPQDQITQAEVVTVLLRILGYNDNLSGSWPANYIAKAASLGVLDDITFIANKAATRGEVAIIGSEVLEQNIVVYEASNNLFREARKTIDGDTRSYILLEDKFESEIETDQLVTDVSLDEGIAFEFNSSGDFIELTETAIIANAPSWNQVKERFVDYVTNDDGDIVYISVQDYGTVKASLDDIELNTRENELSINNRNYRLADEVVLLPEDEETTLEAIFVDRELRGNLLPTGTSLQDFIDLLDYDVIPAIDSLEFVLNDDGRIALIKAWAWESDEAGIVDNVNLNRERIQYKNSDVRTTNLADEDYAILINGLQAELEDIQENDVVYVTDLYDVTLLVVMSAQVPGELESIRVSDGDVTEVRVNGTWFDVAINGFILSADAGSDFYNAKADVDQIDGKYEILGEDVVLLLNPEQKVVGIISDVDAVARNFGIIDGTAAVLDGNQVVKGIKIFRADGSVAAYPLKDDSILDEPDFELLKKNWFVKYSINSDGELELEFKEGKIYPIFIDERFEELELPKGIEFEDIEDRFVHGDEWPLDELNLKADTDLNVITVNNGDAFDLDGKHKTINGSFDISNTTIFNLHRDDDGDIQIVDVEDFLDSINDDSVNAFLVVDGNNIEYIVLYDEEIVGTTGNIAMVVDTGRDIGGNYAYLLLPHGTVKYYVDSGNIEKDEIITFTLKSGEIFINESKEAEKWDINGPYEIKSISGNIIEVITAFNADGNVESTRNIVVNSDTIYYDNENSPIILEKDDIARGDIIKVYREVGETAVAVVELVDEEVLPIR
ncbi:hypothetical protein SYNTR_1880 [Candidatus Syntrophocurvum alkaliphilum]|uniref:SLH domain-containing protein n=1 Tax=Candidatus Syntrophocurvum alkaliphilum TaxID=2293317 RepID=A0A6I6DHR2_9FIRM|nr:S-layer homology domain-containing protein [Candidatus Syntrophocurvum alkaliphilum]QGU00474.1 hypothetical protein SYNTR_1880 [Candidatus Syntrophocurvum alkaliphilum]